MRGDRSFLGSFSVDAFVEDAPWVRLKGLLQSSGGSYGISGPRGSGKTWLMHRALAWASEKRGVGVWFPSPSEFEPTAFLAALSEVTAIRVEEWYDHGTQQQRKRVLLRSFVRAGIGLVIGLIGVVSVVYGTVPRRFPLPVVQIAGVAVAAIGLGVFVYEGYRRSNELSPFAGIRQRAESLRTEVRFAVTRTETLEGTVDTSTPIGTLIKRSRQRQLVERPATLSSLIHNYRSFVRALSDVLNADRLDVAPVIIAIDELDKMGNPEDVAGLLRSVKAILDVPGVHFLVSLSDEAARSLDLGAIRVRNEFNSSFYTVVAVAPFPPSQCEAQLAKHQPLFNRRVSRAIGIVVGGIPREVSRAGELVQAEAGEEVSVATALTSILRAESLALWQEVLAVPVGAGESNDERVRTLSSWILAAAERPFVSDSELDSLWEGPPRLEMGSSLRQDWQRLLIRRAIAGRLVADPAVVNDDGASRKLQHVANVASYSAPVARDLLSEKVELGQMPLPPEAHPTG